tara:strand:+ start:52 stop:423 length:372 start_codon:yes stop_codon:yes gene_type:complete
MLKGFEKLTEELNEYELSIVGDIVKGIGARTGKTNSINSETICKKMKLTPVRLRKIIHFIRINGLLYGLCSNSKGYYTASNLDELEECIISLKQRIKSQVDVLNELEKQRVMFGGSNQITLFE